MAPRDASTEIVEARRQGGARRPGGGEFGRSREVGRVGRSRRLPVSRRLAIVPTLLAAVERSTGQRAPNGLQVEVRAADLRWREHRMRRGTLFIFVVDASGSMAFHRMSETKGAVLRALAAAYLRRDEVALVSVRGERAEILLPPTASMARARAVLERLPIGGGTPLASGLECAASLARSERLRNGREPAVAIFTDGRANVALGPPAGTTAESRRDAVRAELLAVAALFARERIATTLIDVSSAPGADRFLVEFAARLGAERHRLLTRDSRTNRLEA